MKWVINKGIQYKQGQFVNGVRQYFYYIDHAGQLFMDDARMKNFTSCFKGLYAYSCWFFWQQLLADVKFLNFFFARLRVNQRDDDYRRVFPFYSPCGVEGWPLYNPLFWLNLL